MFKRILVPLDGSRLSLLALPYAAEIALRFGAEIILVRVEDRPPSAVGLGVAFAMDEVDANATEAALAAAEHQNQDKVTLAKRYLSRHIRGLANKNIRASKRVILGKPGKAILGVSLQEGVDLIVLTTHGRSGLKRAIMGSVAGELIRAAGVPVLVIKPR